MRLSVTLSAIAALVLAGCVRPADTPPEPTPAPAPAPTVTVPALPPAPQADWRDRPYSPGAWSYVQDARGSLARYGLPDAAPDFAVRCERASRSVRLMRTGTYAPGAAMRVTTSTGVHAYATISAAGATAAAALAEVPARDAGLDAMTFSRGRFVVALPGGPDLVLPARPEMARVVEDCRA